MKLTQNGSPPINLILFSFRSASAITLDQLR